MQAHLQLCQLGHKALIAGSRPAPQALPTTNGPWKKNLEDLPMRMLETWIIQHHRANMCTETCSCELDTKMMWNLEPQIQWAQ
jgi:hypothetical protein